jgi:hypothetical protein
VSPFKVLNVLDIRLATNSEARRLEPAHAKLHSIAGHDLDCLFAQVINESGETKHSLNSASPVNTTTDLMAGGGRK